LGEEISKKKKPQRKGLCKKKNPAGNVQGSDWGWNIGLQYSEDSGRNS